VGRQTNVKPFLTANWRYLTMLNFVIDPAILAPLVPPDTEIDRDHGETFVSIVGFLFLDTRLTGLPLPLHRDFEVANVRFYVRRNSADTWRRGIVLIRNLVPRHAITSVATAFQGERFVALPMKHEIEHRDARIKVDYSWRRGRKWESICLAASGDPQSIPAGTHAEFITERHWGYTWVRNGCNEYRIIHSRWKIWEAETHALQADVTALGGEQFAETLSAPPRSAFIAEGSPIEVWRREQD
jgi:uncharacterized protein YqjF (DUF2071 family)